jgi:hypothetical protein
VGNVLDLKNLRKLGSEIRIKNNYFALADENYQIAYIIKNNHMHNKCKKETVRAVRGRCASLCSPIDTIQVCEFV